MSVKVSSLVKLYIIISLNEGNKHGYELIKELEKKLGKQISASQVYPFLETLKKNKLIKVKKIGKREKKIYSITPKGKKFVKSLLSRFGELVEIAIEPKLKVCAHCGCKIYDGGYTKLIGGKKLTFCCKYCASSYKKANVKK